MADDSDSVEPRASKKQKKKPKDLEEAVESSNPYDEDHEIYLSVCSLAEGFRQKYDLSEDYIKEDENVKGFVDALSTAAEYFGQWYDFGCKGMYAELRESISQIDALIEDQIVSQTMKMSELLKELSEDSYWETRKKAVTCLTKYGHNKETAAFHVTGLTTGSLGETDESAFQADCENDYGIGYPELVECAIAIAKGYIKQLNESQEFMKGLFERKQES